MSKHDAQDMAEARPATLADQIGYASDMRRRAEQLAKAAQQANQDHNGAISSKHAAEEALWKLLCERLDIDQNRREYDAADVREIVMAAVALAVTK